MFQKKNALLKVGFNNTIDPLTAVPYGIFDSSSSFSLLLYMISMGMMSLYDLIHEESVVLNCTPSYWSVPIYPGKSHNCSLFCLTLIGQFRSHDLFELPLQF